MSYAGLPDCGQIGYNLSLASNGPVAQSVEQRIENPCVGGSIPPRATIVLLFESNTYANCYRLAFLFVKPVYIHNCGKQSRLFRRFYFDEYFSGEKRSCH
jgi:hypothetical protein